MRTVSSIAELRGSLDEARHARLTVGLVPTMGYLHDGHLSLMRRSIDECDLTVATIFVNPLQFAAGEDLDAYPRDLSGDTAKADDTGVDLLFTPSVSEMYPDRVRTAVSVDVATGLMESATRPTHFDGVATVVAKLFNIAGPCRAYFGEKDFQQLAVVRQMAADLSFPVEVVGCPIVREPDGLAMSSRNAYLSHEHRSAAPVLYEALLAGADEIARGQLDPASVSAVMASIIEAEPLAHLDYAEAVDALTLSRPDQLTGEIRLLVAAGFGPARLLDNLEPHAP